MTSLFEKAFTLLAGGMIRLLLATCRKRNPHLSSRQLPPPATPLIFYTWHQNLLPLLSFFRNTGIAPLISQSRDGARIAAIARQFGTCPVRGSSSRGGAAAFRMLYRLLSQAQPTPVFITADGPKGPPHKLKEGTLLLARKTGATLIPLSWEGSSVCQLGSWDRFRIPRPFSSITFLLGTPLPASELPEDTEKACLLLEQSLEALSPPPHRADR